MLPDMAGVDVLCFPHAPLQKPNNCWFWEDLWELLLLEAQWVCIRIVSILQRAGRWEKLQPNPATRTRMLDPMACQKRVGPKLQCQWALPRACLSAEAAAQNSNLFILSPEQVLR